MKPGIKTRGYAPVAEMWPSAMPSQTCSSAVLGPRRPARRPACPLDRPYAGRRVRPWSCTVLAVLHVLGTLLGLTLVLA